MTERVILKCPIAAFDSMHVLIDAARGHHVKIEKAAILALLIDHIAVIGAARRHGVDVIDEEHLPKPRTLHRRSGA